QQSASHASAGLQCPHGSSERRSREWRQEGSRTASTLKRRLPQCRPPRGARRGILSDVPAMDQHHSRTIDDAPTPRHPDTPTPRHPDTPTPRHPDTPTPRHPDTPTSRHPDTPTPRRGICRQPWHILATFFVQYAGGTALFVEPRGVCTQRSVPIARPFGRPFARPFAPWTLLVSAAHPTPWLDNASTAEQRLTPDVGRVGTG
ncbi:hypothetical protein SAMN05216551_1071, partial [Chitinasiproducens palmae]